MIQLKIKDRIEKSIGKGRYVDTLIAPVDITINRSSEELTTSFPVSIEHTVGVTVYTKYRVSPDVDMNAAECLAQNNLMNVLYEDVLRELNYISLCVYGGDKKSALERIKSLRDSILTL